MEQLGNQMFQYATARKFAIQAETQLVLDVSFFSFRRKRLLLRYFAIHAKIRYMYIYLILKRLNILKRESFHYTKLKRYGTGYQCVTNSSLGQSNLYLYGLFQNFNNFDNIKDVLKKDFQLTINIWSDYALEVKKAIEKEMSVAIHVRRGDYLDNPSLNVCTLDYYKKAMQYISSSVSNPIFIIFSNDIDYCRNNMHIENALYVHNDNSDKGVLADFTLMRLCKHHIISNSTFSWWAAYLSEESENHLVVCPNKWSNDDSIPLSSFLLPDWKTIDFSS